MLKRRPRERMGLRESTRIRSTGHLQFVRGFVCICFASGECDGKTEAHHVREDGNAGTGIKPGDENAVSLCALHHYQLHQIGRITFEARHKVDLGREAEKLWRLSPHRRRFEQ